MWEGGDGAASALHGLLQASLLLEVPVRAVHPLMKPCVSHLAIQRRARRRPWWMIGLANVWALLSVSLVTLPLYRRAGSIASKLSWHKSYF